VALWPTTSPTAGQGIEPEITTRFVCGNYRAIYRLPLSAGRWPDTLQATSPYEVVLNKPAARILGGVGTTVWLTSPTTDGEFPARVVGIVNDGSVQPQLVTNALAWLTNAPQLLTPQTLTLLWHQTDTTLDHVQQATGDWLTDHRLSTDSDAIETDTLADFQRFITLVQLSFTGVAALSLLVAAIGIVNVGLASVKERSHELVIRRAIGASKLNVSTMIIGSSLVLATIVAAVSIGVAWTALILFRGRLAYDSPMQPPGFPLAAALIGITVAIGTALLGSTIPGIVASRLQPGLALRD
jgi:putative ABC transport system permease protein